VQLGHPEVVEELARRASCRGVTIQLSFEFMLPMDAAAPPSAMTVCALPNSDLEMIAVRLPACRASIAARRPSAAGTDDDHVVRLPLNVCHVFPSWWCSVRCGGWPRAATDRCLS